MSSHLIVAVSVDAAHRELLADALWQLGAVAVGETARGLEAGFEDDAVAAAAAAALGDSEGTVELVADDGAWRQTWRASARPITIGPVRVRLPEHPPAAMGFHDLVVEPGEAFGSGDHPTTRLALQALVDFVGPGSSVFDVGTGTGVLAIAAAKLGAGRVLAIDVDGEAVGVARANVEANGAGHVVEVSNQPVGAIEETFDAVVANLGGSVVLRTLGSDLAARTKDRGGLLIVTGLLASANEIEESWFPEMSVLERRHLLGWDAVVLACDPGAGRGQTVAVTTTEATIDGVPIRHLVEDFRTACISRALNDREISLQKQSRVFFQISGAGHEALLLALARHLRPGYDWFFPYYRDLALVLGLGVTPEEVLLQAVGSADDPSSGGRQMPAHWGNKALNIVTQSSPTGSQCIPAVGCAEAARYISRRPHLPGCEAKGDEITYVSLGEGATSEGEFWESLNTACTLHLPVLFVVADNGYAISVPSADQSPAPISELVQGFRGLEILKFDGRDYLTSWRETAKAVAWVRAGTGPALIHATVTRPYSHSAADTQAKYRSAAELAEEATHDPIHLLELCLIERGVFTVEQANTIREEARREVAEAARIALAAPRPDPARITDHVVDMPTGLVEDTNLAGDDGDVVPFGEAIKRTLHEQMEGDERIRVFGEDVADARETVLADVEGKGGVFGTTHGLQRRFGQARCYNTPLAEANVIGRAVGQAIRGLKPAPEIQFFDYIWPAMQQIKSEAATIRWRSNGAYTCPTVIRVPIGGYLTGGSIWHSQCGESIFTHIPGLLIAFPSRARDAAGLLRASFKMNDPVLFLEHKHLLRQPYTRDPFPGPDYLVPFGKGDIRRRGSDVTVVTWGATVHKSLEAAERISEEGGGEAEVIDLRSLAPWDKDLVGESVRRTSRVVVVHEDVMTSGFGAEVAAWIADELFYDLDAPVRRVAALDTHVPYEPSLEKAVLPQIDDIAEALRDLLSC